MIAIVLGFVVVLSAFSAATVWLVRLTQPPSNSTRAIYCYAFSTRGQAPIWHEVRTF